jgi:hypothetical protein
MRTTTGRTIFEKPPFLIYPVFFTNILQTVESGSKEPEHNLGSAVLRSDKS